MNKTPTYSHISTWIALLIVCVFVAPLHAGATTQTISTSNSPSYFSTTATTSLDCDAEDIKIKSLKEQLNSLAQQKNTLDQTIVAVQNQANEVRKKLSLNSSLQSTSTSPIACTADAKVCPDGSYVGRTAPSCAFAECPPATSNSTKVTTSFTLRVSPSPVVVGIPFNISVSVGSISTRAYSLSVSATGASNYAKLENNIAVNTVVRPQSAEKSYTTSYNTPPGTYTVKVVDDADPSKYQTANFTVVSAKNPTSTTGTNTTFSVNGCLDITRSLEKGLSDSTTKGQVTLLQNFLASAGFLKVTPTGYFGNGTLNAVKAYQATIVSMPSTGFAGPLTRQAIKSQTCGN